MVCEQVVDAIRRAPPKRTAVERGFRERTARALDGNRAAWPIDASHGRKHGLHFASHNRRTLFLPRHVPRECICMRPSCLPPLTRASFCAAFYR